MPHRPGEWASPTGGSLAQVIKTIHTTHTGKLSLVRVLRGSLRDGADAHDVVRARRRVSGISRLMGQTAQKIAEAVAGTPLRSAALTLHDRGHAVGRQARSQSRGSAPSWAAMAISVRARDRKDEVKLGAALRKLIDEDRAIEIEQDPVRGETDPGGQGEMHLRVSIERWHRNSGSPSTKGAAHVGYRETIRKPVKGIRGRHKKQSGGHGQFGDIVIDVDPCRAVAVSSSQQDHRRRGPAPVHPLGRGWAARALSRGRWVSLSSTSA